MGDDKVKLTFDISTMNEGTMEEKVQEHTRATNYASEEARNAYKSLLLRNSRAREDINAYKKHQHEKELFKQAQEQGQKMKSKIQRPAALSPQTSAFPAERESSLKQPGTVSNLKSCFNRYPKEEADEEKPKQ